MQDTIDKGSEIKDPETMAKEVVDDGIEKGLSRLTDEKISEVINQVLTEETGVRFKAYVETCMRCGLCADACSVFLSNDRRPQYSPAAKVKLTILEMINKKGKVSKDFLRDAVRISHTECNVCKKCAMYCPFGIDIAYMMLLVRRICHKLEITPLYVRHDQILLLVFGGGQKPNYQF